MINGGVIVVQFTILVDNVSSERQPVKDFLSIF